MAGCRLAFTPLLRRSAIRKIKEDLVIAAAVDQALSKIRRIGRGVYDIPKDHPMLGPLLPDPDAVARAIAAQALYACSQRRRTRQTCLVSLHRYPRRSSI